MRCNRLQKLRYKCSLCSFYVNHILQTHKTVFTVPHFYILHYWDHVNYNTFATEATIKRISVSMPPELHQEMKMHSVANYTTINDLVVSAIKMYLNENDNDVNLAPNRASSS